jgi:DNA-binding MarR family transcriptional regulator
MSFGLHAKAALRRSFSKGSAADRRVREVVITPKGKAMTDRVDAARERIGRAIFETWDAHDIDELVRLTRKFADAVKDESSSGAPTSAS